jgi:hypothetical protein
VRSLFPRPFLLALTLLLFASAVVAIELRLGVPVATRENGGKEAASPAGGSERRGEQGEGTSPVAVGRTTLEKKFGGSVARIERKEAQYRRAEEITAPTGFINTDGVSINEARGEKVVLWISGPTLASTARTPSRTSTPGTRSTRTKGSSS